MVVEVSRICGSVRLHGGMTSYLGRAWCDLELPGCHCMGACISETSATILAAPPSPNLDKTIVSFYKLNDTDLFEVGTVLS